FESITATVLARYTSEPASKLYASVESIDLSSGLLPLGDGTCLFLISGPRNTVSLHRLESIGSVTILLTLTTSTFLGAEVALSGTEDIVRCNISPLLTFCVGGFLYAEFTGTLSMYIVVSSGVISSDKIVLTLFLVKNRI